MPLALVVFNPQSNSKSYQKKWRTLYCQSSTIQSRSVWDVKAILAFSGLSPGWSFLQMMMRGLASKWCLIWCLLLTIGLLPMKLQHLPRSHCDYPVFSSDLISFYGHWGFGHNQKTLYTFFLRIYIYRDIYVTILYVHIYKTPMFTQSRTAWVLHWYFIT